MTSSRPYLIRALYEWLVDNQLTPHLLVDVERENVNVPMAFVEGGRIVLNVAPSAVRDLDLGNEAITFSARFGGQPHAVYVPPAAVLGVYARENGQGMRVLEETVTLIVAGQPQHAGRQSDHSSDRSSDDEPKPPRGGGRPSLKVVK